MEFGFGVSVGLRGLGALVGEIVEVLTGVAVGIEVLFEVGVVVMFFTRNS